MNMLCITCNRDVVIMCDVYVIQTTTGTYITGERFRKLFLPRRIRTPATRILSHNLTSHSSE